MNNSEVVIVSSWSVLVSHGLIGVSAALWIYQKKSLGYIHALQFSVREIALKSFI